MRALLVVSIFLAVAGCRRAPAPTMSDSTFVQTMADLRRIEADSAMDSTLRDSMRHVILRRHRVTTKGLEDRARALAADPQHAVDLFQAIDQHVAHRAPAPRTTDPH